jgi:hypothetical protein
MANGNSSEPISSLAVRSLITGIMAALAVAEAARESQALMRGVRRAMSRWWEGVDEGEEGRTFLAEMKWFGWLQSVGSPRPPGSG